jgi:hypothetical protein
MCVLIFIDLPAWIEAIGVIATLVVAIITLISQNKIKTLTDVVKEMKQQTDYLSRSYLLQEQLSKYERIPYFDGLLFEQISVARTLIDEFSLKLINNGLAAINVEIGQLTDPSLRISHRGDAALVNNKDVITYNIKSEKPYLRTKDFQFEFFLRFYDNNGQAYHQLVGVRKSRIIILPPIIVETVHEAFGASVKKTVSNATGIPESEL